MAKKPKTKSAKKSWMAMNPAELAEATKQFDRGIDLSETRPLSAENRKWWNKARKGGRPKVGKGSKPILITMEQGLLEEADAYAKKLGMNRSQLFAKGIESLLNRRAG